MNLPNLSNPHSYLLLVLLLFSQSLIITSRNLGIRKQHQQVDQGDGDDSLTYIWPLPWQYTSGNQTLTVDPDLSIVADGSGANSLIISEAFDRYKRIIFRHTSPKLRSGGTGYDLSKLNVIVHSENEEVAFEFPDIVVQCSLSLSFLFGFCSYNLE